MDESGIGPPYTLAEIRGFPPPRVSYDPNPENWREDSRDVFVDGKYVGAIVSDEDGMWAADARLLRSFPALASDPSLYPTGAFWDRRADLRLQGSPNGVLRAVDRAVEQFPESK